MSMAQPIAPDYGQQFLFPPALEDWVPADHPARFLREFVDQLDLAQLGFSMPASVEGRPPYAPSLLLKIWLYGYFFHIRATRKLEAACREVLPLVWLSGLIQPDHNSLWRFWRDNQKALRAVFKQTVQVAWRSGCVGLVLQAVDGTKIEAAASGYSGWTKEHMEKLLAQLEASLADTELKVLAENDTPATVSLPAGLAQRAALREEIKKGLAQLQADGRQHYQPVEPEARRMQLGNGTNRFAYNAQAVADAKAGIIVACDVTRQENDTGQLVPMIEQARQNLELKATAATTLGDSGYGSGTDLQQAQEKHLSVLVVPLEGTNDPDHPYARRHFKIDAAAGQVICPRGVLLDYEGKTTKRGAVVERYRCHCRDCPVRSQCTKDPKGRQIEVWPYAQAIQDMRERLAQPLFQHRLHHRAEIIEPCFGHIKQQMGFRRWTVWGLAQVKTQWALLCATSNLKKLFVRWKDKQNHPGATGWASFWAEILRFVLRYWLQIAVGCSARKPKNNFGHLTFPKLMAS